MTGAAGASDGPEPAARSVLAGAEPVELAPDDETAYELVIDLLDSVVGLYSERIRAAEHAPGPDPEAIARLVAEQVHYLKTRAALTPQDQAQVAALRSECAAILGRPEPQNG